MKFNKKGVIIFAILSLLLVYFTHFIHLQNVKYAQASLWDMAKEGGIEEIGSKAFGQSGDPIDPRSIAINVVRVFLGFLAIIFVILIIVAGYKWMVAAGNEDTIKGAKSQIKAAIIGLIIILIAYSITVFVMIELRKKMFDQIW